MADFIVMFENALTYNEPNSQVKMELLSLRRKRMFAVGDGRFQAEGDGPAETRERRRCTARKPESAEGEIWVRIKHIRTYSTLTTVQGLIHWERPAFALAVRRDNETFLSFS